MACVAIPYPEQMKEMANKILMAAAKPYTEAQMKEIPAILNCKHRYFWGNDLNDWEVLRDVFTAEGEGGFKAYWTGGGGGPIDIEKQIGSVMWSIGPQEGMVPTHYGHNQVVYFIDDTHCQLLTRMQDRHVYLDDGEVYGGWGMYIDDLLKCADGVWRIETIRLEYGQMEGQLRCVRRMMEQQAQG